MKQSDILSYAINGVIRDLKDAETKVYELSQVLKELREVDKAHEEPELALRWPKRFVAEPLLKSDKL